MPKMRNHPNDTICHRAVVRKGTPRLRTWLASTPRIADRTAIERAADALDEGGAQELYVYEVDDIEDGGVALVSLIATLPRTDDKIAKLSAVIKRIETERGIEIPGEGIGFQYAQITFAP